MEIGGAKGDFWEDEEAEWDEGNSTTYSGIDLMNEGLDGRGGAVDWDESRRKWYDVHSSLCCIEL